ncbi:MAG: hypothetical protein NZ550_04690 [Fimbriimonadales bacterium]|nr:hypothetical protein [Fimbriimonadales bacterium]MDW8051624.1 hypothetical protein [Armatimonadota bacterium]
MMHKGMLYVATVVAASLLALITPTPAQETAQTGITLSIGAFFPSEKDVRRASEDAWFSVELDYRLQTSEPNERGYYYDLGVSVGYRGSGDNYYIPVHATFTGYLSEQFFYRAGAGIGFPKQGRVFTADDASFSYSIELGYNFTAGETPIALTVGYAGIARNSVNGFTVGISARF